MQRAYRIMATQIKASESDQHIRLDYKRLLTVDALKSVTDNPDEAEYMGRVRNTLESKGIWLRFDNELVRDPEDPSRWIVDPRTFRAWLSVGYDGDAIPPTTDTDRELLLAPSCSALVYYDAVHRGPTRAPSSADRDMSVEMDPRSQLTGDHRKVKARS